ncbi:MAG: hypothetical protein K8R48_06210 [Alphaproteobacteria bacterium]|nr:hypothetical protein [Alphaproteobacteria bacterium]
MSRVYRSADPQHIFRSAQEIEEHLLSKIQKGTVAKIGTELELFVTGPEGLPITFDQVEMLLEHLAEQFTGVKKAMEKGRIVGLAIPDLGDICLEPGGQVEIATVPCNDLAQLDHVNRTLRDTLDASAAFFGLKVTGTGHMPSFLQAGDMPRSRFHAYYRYCRHEHGAKAEDLIKTMKSCCGLQVNLDPLGDQFHEVYRALALIDLAVVHAEESTRRDRFRATYTTLFPEQTKPILEALTETSNEGIVHHIVDRLLTLKVPFVPDTSPEGFKSTLDVFGHAPRVGELLASGKLTAEILDNSLSLQLMGPNLRRHGVLETRAPDSLNSTDELMRISAIYRKYAYDAEARAALLQKFAEAGSQVTAETMKKLAAYVGLTREEGADLRITPPRPPRPSPGFGAGQRPPSL